MLKDREHSAKTGWLLLSVLVQAGIGATVVPYRYLQTVAGLPGLALVGFSTLVAFLIMSWRLIPKIDKRYWTSKTLWILVMIVIIRTIFQIFATRYTKAYIVQLINLLAPFWVVLLNRIIVKTKLPQYTILAISLSLLGSVLMVFGGLANQPLTPVLTQQDLIGITFAFIATFGIAAYMMIVKRGKQIGLPFEIVYISQIGTLMLVMPLLSLIIGEDWSKFYDMNWVAVLVFLVNAVGAEVGCKIGNISTLRELGAPLVSSMLAMRLVAALFLGWFILGERLDSALQWVGALIVLLTVTGYLLKQANLKKSVFIQ